MRRGRINSEGRKLVGGLWGGNLKIYRGRGSSRGCIWGEKMQLEWDLDTVQCEQKSIQIHLCGYIKPKYTKYFKINWRGCIWGRKDATGVRLGKLRRQGARLVHRVKKYFYLAIFHALLYFKTWLVHFFQKAFLPHYVSYTSKVSDHCLYAMFHTLLYFKTRLVHCVKKVHIFYLAIFPSLQDKAVHGISRHW